MLKNKKFGLSKVPSLDFGLNLELDPNKTAPELKMVKSKSVDSLVLESRKINLLVKDLKEILNEIKATIIYNDADIIKDIASIKYDVHNILTSSDRSPRMLSKIDAVVANSQLLISRFDDRSKVLSAEIVTHDRTVVNSLTNLTVQLMQIEEKMDLLSEKVDLLSEKISDVEKTTDSPKEESLLKIKW